MIQHPSLLLAAYIESIAKRTPELLGPNVLSPPSYHDMKFHKKDPLRSDKPKRHLFLGLNSRLKPVNVSEYQAPPVKPPKSPSKPRKKLPEVPLEQQILALIDGVTPFIIREPVPRYLELLSNPFKLELLEKIDSESISPQDEEYLNDHENKVYLLTSRTLNYLRTDHPNLRPVLKPDYELAKYPTIASIPTKVQRLHIKGSAIVNVTEKSPYDHLFVDARPQKLKLVPIQDTSKKLKRFSAKAKRFSQMADDRLNGRVTERIVQTGPQLAPSASPLMAQMSNIDVGLLALQQRSQQFIKYHVYGHENRLLLTTNPDRRHVYCKYAPGFTVDVQRPNLDATQRQALEGGNPADLGFRLVFQGPGDKPEIVVTKRSKLKGGAYVVWTLEGIVLDQENDYVKVASPSEYTKTETQCCGFLESYHNSELQYTLAKADPRRIMNRYELETQDGVWTVGLLPKIKSSGFGRLKHASKDFLLESSDTADKITHKNHVYFFAKNGTRNKNSNLHVRLSDYGSIPKKTTGAENGILALFRPHETKFRKKLAKDLKRLKNKTSDKFYIHLADTSYSFNGMDGMDEASEAQETAKTELFFQPGDGIIDKYTPDDSPVDSKLGWLTMYNELCLRETGLFEIVLGMTVAVGYERLLNAS